MAHLKTGQPGQDRTESDLSGDTPPGQDRTSILEDVRVSGVRTQANVLQPSSKVRQAIDLLVFEGHHRNDAAKAVGLSPKGLYNQFRRHHVLAYHRATLGALRESARSRNFHRLEQLRDQDDNRAAAVKAIQVLEQISDEADQRQPRGPITQPGLTIVIVQPAAATLQPVTIEHPVAIPVATQADAELDK